ATTTTAPVTGAFSFGGLTQATYFVKEVVPDGDAQLSPGGPGYYTVTLTANQIVTGENFVNFSAPIAAGQFATIGFWHNKNGQAVINSFNGGPTSTALGNWMATTFPHLFGSSNPYTGTSLAGLTNAQVANVFSNLWNPSGV